MKASVITDDVHAHLLTAIKTHQELNDEADRLNEKNYHTPAEALYLREVKRKRLRLRDQIENLRYQLGIQE